VLSLLFSNKTIVPMVGPLTSNNSFAFLSQNVLALVDDSDRPISPLLWLRYFESATVDAIFHVHHVMCTNSRALAGMTTTDHHAVQSLTTSDKSTMSRVQLRQCHYLCNPSYGGHDHAPPTSLSAQSIADSFASVLWGCLEGSDEGIACLSSWKSGSDANSFELAVWERLSHPEDTEGRALIIKARWSKTKKIWNASRKHLYIKLSAFRSSLQELRSLALSDSENLLEGDCVIVHSSTEPSQVRGTVQCSDNLRLDVSIGSPVAVRSFRDLCSTVVWMFVQSMVGRGKGDKNEKAAKLKAPVRLVAN